MQSLHAGHLDDPRTAHAGVVTLPVPEPVRSAHPRARSGTARGTTPARTVRTVLASSIRHGVLPPGGQVVEDDVVAQLHASRTSVREALANLTDSGVLSRRRKVGTVVVAAPLEIPVAGIVPEGPDHDVRSRKVTDHVVPVHPLISAVLRLTDERVLLREFVMALREDPIGFRSCYRSAEFDGSDPVPAGTNDLDGWFRGIFGRELGVVQTVIEFATADVRTASLLDVVVGAPLLVREQIFHDVDGVPRELAFTQVRADLVSFSDRR